MPKIHTKDGSLIIAWYNPNSPKKGRKVDRMTDLNAMMNNVDKDIPLTPSAKLCRFSAYDAQLTIKPIEGARIVKCLYKQNDKTKAKRANEYCFVPSDHLTTQSIEENLGKFLPYFLAYLQGVEDDYVKDNHKKRIGIYPVNFSISKILDLLESSGVARLTKDMIEAFFEAEIANGLLEILQTKLGITEETEVTEVQLVNIEAVLAAYKDMIASLAAPKPAIKEDNIEQILKLFASCKAEETGLGKRLIDKLESLKQDTNKTLENLGL